VIKYLGRGDFSNVRLTERKSGDSSGSKKELFAMKIVPKAGISKYVQSRRNVEKEVSLRTIEHPFLIQLHSHFES